MWTFARTDEPLQRISGMIKYLKNSDLVGSKYGKEEDLSYASANYDSDSKT